MASSESMDDDNCSNISEEIPLLFWDLTTIQPIQPLTEGSDVSQHSEFSDFDSDMDPDYDPKEDDESSEDDNDVMTKRSTCRSKACSDTATTSAASITEAAATRRAKSTALAVATMPTVAPKPSKLTASSVTITPVAATTMQKSTEPTPATTSTADITIAKSTVPAVTNMLAAAIKPTKSTPPTTATTSAKSTASAATPAAVTIPADSTAPAEDFSNPSTPARNTEASTTLAKSASPVTIKPAADSVVSVPSISKESASTYASNSGMLITPAEYNPPVLDTAAHPALGPETRVQKKPAAEATQVASLKDQSPGRLTSRKKTKPKRPCVYCGQFQSALHRHFIRRHKTEEAVKAALLLPEKERNRAFDALKKEGIYAKNVEILTQESGNDNLLRERAQGSQKTLMCSACKGFYCEKRISLHKKICYGKAGTNVSATSVDFCAQKSNVPMDFQRNVLDHLRRDDIGLLCRKDSVTLLLGLRLWAKSVKKDRRGVMSDMRTFASLILRTNEVANDKDITGEDLLQRKYFDHLTQAINDLTTRETGGQKAGQKCTIGFVLKKAIKVMRGYYAQHNHQDKSEELEKFSNVLDLNWDYIFYSAQIHCEQRRNSLRQPEDMPMEKDIAKLRNFVVESMDKMIQDLYTLFDIHKFVVLRNLIVTRLTMYNARRGGEPGRLTLKEWQDAENGKWIDPELVQNVSDPLEKALMDKHKLAYQAGKGSRRLVPVLIPNDTLAPLRKLVEERSNVGICADNPFLFPNTGQSLDHVTGWNCINWVTKEMGGQLERPSFLTADKFRHRASTVFALQEVPESEREIFYRHMGHSGSINKNVYQCPLAVLEVTRVGGFLESLDLKGKTATCTMASQKNCSTKITLPTTSVTSPSCPAAEPVAPNKKDVAMLPFAPDVDDVSILISDGQSATLAKQLFESDSIDSESLCPKPTTVLSDKEIQNQCTQEHSEVNVTASGSETTGKKCRKRTYYQWSETDAKKVVDFFRKDIHKSGKCAQGSLPGVKEIDSFLVLHDVFPGVSLEKKQKINLIKTKIFNERNKFRANKHFDQA